MQKSTLPLPIGIAFLLLILVSTGATWSFAQLDSTHDRQAASTELELWLGEARQALADNRLVEPPGDNAAEYFQRILQDEPSHAEAAAGLADIQRQLIRRAWVAAREMDFELANEWLQSAAAVQAERSAVDLAGDQIEAFRSRRSLDIEQDIDQMLSEGEFNRAEILLLDLVALGDGESRLDAIRQRIERARVYGRFAPGAVIRDALNGLDARAPAVVVIQAGSFLMGSSGDEPGFSENEAPRHRVTLAHGFALGQREVSVAEFRIFVEADGYRSEAVRAGSSTIYNERTGRLSERDGIDWRHDYAGRPADDDLPVLHITWNDAQAYVRWLSQQSGQAYRLPTEAEFEYAMRAGSLTSYWWGNGTPSESVENLTGSGDVSPGGRHWSLAFEGYGDGHWGPAPTGSYPANGFGLHDMAGNVSEWVMDCWHSNYSRAPADGSAWVNPGCERRVVRGGYWAGNPNQARSAARLYADAHLHGPRAGFRVARDL